LINALVRDSDYFLLVLHDRWGSPTGDGHSSGSEEELEVATTCHSERSMRDIAMLFRGVDPRQLSDPGAQLQRVLDFKKKLQAERAFLYQTYDDLSEFAQHVQRCIYRWARDHDDREGDSAAREDTPPPEAPADIGPMVPSFVPGDTSQGPVGSPPEPDQRPSQTAAAEPSNPAVAQAWALADEGKIVQAEAQFAGATTGRWDPNALIEHGRFLVRVGRLTAAEERFVRAADHSDQDEDRARALTNLGHVHRTRGEFDRAEQAYNEALNINEAIGRKRGIADVYCNLGIIHRIRGDLGAAEKLHRLALAINEELGLPGAMAIDYSSLGHVYDTRGDFDLAEEFHRKALALEESIGRKEGIASEYGSLGNIYATRGELDLAEQMVNKSLEINRVLGRAEGLSGNFGCLGSIYLLRGDWLRAEEAYRKALDISERLGRSGGVSSNYGNLGIVYQYRGKLDLAEEMFMKALAIDESLGQVEGVASQYGNLGNIYMMRGQTGFAREMWTKALDLFRQIGAKPQVEQTQRLLASLDFPPAG
jgi:tetratricopeptide (TPR) repeat protein